MNLQIKRNNRQTLPIVSWRHANTFFRDIEPMISFLSLSLSLHVFLHSFYVRDFTISRRSRSVFWSMSSFYSIFFLLLRRPRCIGTTMPIKRTSFDFLPLPPVGRWMKVNANDSSSWQKKRRRKGYFNWFSSSNFAVLLSSSWLTCSRRKKTRESETEWKGYHHS